MSTSQIDSAKIGNAMDALLRAIVENEAKLTVGGRARAIYIVTAAEIDEGDVSSKELDGIIADPVGVACRSEITSLCSMLFVTLGSAELAVDVLERVAGMDPANINERRAILDEAWKHVGPKGDVGRE